MPAKAVEYATEEAKAAAAVASDASHKLVADAQRTVADAARRLETIVQESLEQFRAQSRVYADTAGQQLDEAQRLVSDKVRERPLAATGAAIGVGVLIGLLLSAGRR